MWVWVWVWGVSVGAGGCGYGCGVWEVCVWVWLWVWVWVWGMGVGYGCGVGCWVGLHVRVVLFSSYRTARSSDPRAPRAVLLSCLLSRTGLRHCPGLFQGVHDKAFAMLELSALPGPKGWYVLRGSTSCVGRA